VGRPWIAAGIVMATLLALGAQTSIVARTGFLLGDFRAFYCAARVASQGANPYRTEPLRTCEQAVFDHRNAFFVADHRFERGNHCISLYAYTQVSPTRILTRRHRSTNASTLEIVP
jgi:hypothetical protein